MRMMNPVLQDSVTRLVGSMGYELVGCDLALQGRQMTLRVYIDGPNGVTVDDCSLVSRQIGAMLDVENIIQGRYILEVSSPGVDRPLFTIDHYRKYVGSRVKIRLHTPVNQSRRYTGILKSVEGEDIHLLVEESGQEVVLSFSVIDKANLIGDVRF